MKILKRLLFALFPIVLISLLAAENLAQQHPQLPPELNQSSSLSEILAWLDKNGLSLGRVGLDAGYESAVFSQGFKVAKADGCYLTLRNDNIKLLRFGTSAFPGEYESLERFRKQPEDAAPAPAELYIRLNRMNPEKGKRPHLYTKDPAKTRVFGSWQSEFKSKSGRSRPQDILLIKIFPTSSGDRAEQMYGADLTFTFDSQEMSENFDAAFRQAVKLCNAK